MDLWTAIVVVGAVPALAISLGVYYACALLRGVRP